MMRKFLLCLLILITVIGLTGCGKKEINPDALKFKEEYEKMNGEEVYGKKVRELDIPEDNPFVYATAEEIVEMIDNEETFAVYFGFSSCPWCRAALPTIIEVAGDLGLDTIYYVDVKNIRNVLKVEDDELITKFEGTEGYIDLLDRLDDVLADYELKDEDGEAVDTKMKRIYAPNVVSIVNGKAEKLTDATSEKLKDPLGTVDKDMKKETYDKIKCTLECVSNQNNVCDKKC